jgi:N-acetyl-anhydromuramyl-L-alanine amidase AmpD
MIEWLMNLYDIPVENILGHREVGKLAGHDWRLGQFKTCPGKGFDMDKFRARYA